jgi:hypothetical protein
MHVMSIESQRRRAESGESKPVLPEVQPAALVETQEHSRVLPGKGETPSRTFSAFIDGEWTSTSNELFQLDVSFADLQRVIDRSLYLTSVAERNPSHAFLMSYYRALADRATSGDEKKVVYYPGIGGGDEPVDPLSAFMHLDADEVIGVDLQFARNPDRTKVNVAFEKAAMERELFGISDVRTDETSATFLLDGRPRKLTVYKGDATTFIPPGTLPSLLYQRRETSLIPRLPQQIIDAAQLIYCSDDHGYSPQSAANMGRANGFAAIDLEHVFRTLDQSRGEISTYWSGWSQLLIREGLIQSNK